MSYKPEERDDFELGKRLYRQTPKKKPPYYLIITLVLVVVGIFIAIVTMDSDKKTSVSIQDANPPRNPDRPVATHVKRNTIQQEEKSTDKANISSSNTPPKNTGSDTAAEPIDESTFVETGIKQPRSRQFERAKQYFKNKDYEKALPLLKEMAAKNKDILVLVGFCYYMMDDYTNARDNFQEALTIKENNAFVLKYLSWVCWKLDDIDQSIKYAEASLAIKKDAELQAHYANLKREDNAMDGYGKAERMNFNIVFSKSEHNDIRVVVTEILESAYHDIGQEFDAYPASPVSVILYNKKNFSEVTRVPGWVGGLFDQIDGKIRVPIQGMQTDSQELKWVLYHEYTHALIHSITTRCPRWLHEGLASYLMFEAHERDRIRTVGQTIPLKHLNRALTANDSRVSGYAYLQSYSVVNYLIDRYKFYRIKELLDDLAKGTDMNTAFSSAFSISFDQFAKTWEKES